MRRRSLEDGAFQGRALEREGRGEDRGEGGALKTVRSKAEPWNEEEGKRPKKEF